MTKKIEVVEYVDCETCEGLGYLEYGGMAMEDDLVEQEPCFDCDGKGEVKVNDLVSNDPEAKSKPSNPQSRATKVKE